MPRGLIGSALVCGMAVRAFRGTMSQPRVYDCAIVGLGAMGSAAAWHLARRGASVLGLDRWTPPHVHGSSHGRTRIIREAYFEDPRYVPLVQRAYTLWSETERLAGERLFQRTGGLMIGPPDGGVAGGARRSAEQHGLSHEVLSASEIRERFPAFAPADGSVGVWEPRAGILCPERAVAAHLRLAASAGADLRMDQPLGGWTADAEGVHLATAQGEFRARRLVLCAGGWVNGLLPPAARMPLRIERQVQWWFDVPEARAGDFAPERFPVFVAEFPDGRAAYGFPDLGEGCKVALHRHAKPDAQVLTPDALPREVTADDEAAVRAVLWKLFPALAEAPVQETAACFYTTTPDGHFWIDRHPAHENVWIISPCSGHGFKFASAVGEAAADLALTGQARGDWSLFRARNGR